MSKRQFIEIQLTKCKVFLTEQEFIGLLARDPVLWEDAIRRGKAILRSRVYKARSVKTSARETAGIDRIT